MKLKLNMEWAGNKRRLSNPWKRNAQHRPRIGQIASYGVTVSLFLGSSCRDLGRRYWVPNAEQREQAERIAKFHVFTNLSDQAGPSSVQRVQIGPDGLPKEYPITFTIGGVPYSRYRTRIWGAIQRGRRVVHVQFVDPSRHPDWQQREDLPLDFPRVFEVVVDLAEGRTIRDSRPDPNRAAER